MSDYRSIEANGMTYILSEDDALRLFHAMMYEFDWSGAIFIREDLRSSINERRIADDKEPLDDEALEEAIDTIVGSREWTRNLPDWMVEQGWEVIGSAIWEHLEQ